MLSTRDCALAALLLLCGCPTTNSDADPPLGGSAGERSGGGTAGQQTVTGRAGGTGTGGSRGTAGAAGSAGVAGAGGTAGAAGGDPIEMPKLPDPGLPPFPPAKPIAVGCASNSECASGFCADGVCCNTACDAQCVSCNQPGQLGYCASQTVGDDINGATPCTGPRTCGAPNSGLNAGACRMKNLQACRTDGDCASLHCATFYLDRDQDGYGDAATSLKLCEEPGSAPPGGYVAVAGDCCDSDANTHPGQAKYFTAVNACGSWDWNCDQAIDGLSGFTSYPNEPVGQCGTTVHGACTSCTNTISCH